MRIPSWTASEPRLAQLVPAWRVPGEEPYRASPMELGEAALRLLTGVAGERGCLLVLEDLHWADPDTAAVVEYIGDNLAAEPVACVLTLRPDVGTSAMRVTSELAARRSARRIELQRLVGRRDDAHGAALLGNHGTPVRDPCARGRLLGRAAVPGRGADGVVRSMRGRSCAARTVGTSGPVAPSPSRLGSSNWSVGGWTHFLQVRLGAVHGGGAGVAGRCRPAAGGQRCVARCHDGCAAARRRPPAGRR